VVFTNQASITRNVRAQTASGSAANNSNLDVSGFLVALFSTKEQFIPSSGHLTLVTQSQNQEVAQRRSAACALQIAQPVTMGMHVQVYGESPVGASNVKLTSDVLTE
jgi:hypothetical protein